jgi:hypothetical protein
MSKHHDAYWDGRITEAIERAVGFYYEKTKHDIGLVLEATDFINGRLEDMVTRGEFNELVGEVKLITLALTDTNKDLRRLTDRVDSLETTIQHA